MNLPLTKAHANVGGMALPMFLTRVATETPPSGHVSCSHPQCHHLHRFCLCPSSSLSSMHNVPFTPAARSRPAR
jgi:hypothetical protein